MKVWRVRFAHRDSWYFESYDVSAPTAAAAIAKATRLMDSDIKPKPWVREVDCLSDPH